MKTLPSWAVVATADHAIHPNAERDMAKRAGSEITEIDASHAVLATHPADVAAVIVRAVKASRRAHRPRAVRPGAADRRGRARRRLR